MVAVQISDKQLNEAADLLRQGRLVAFPTETVYGLGADASNADALKRLYSVKGRPTDHPVIVHLADVADLSKWAKDIPQAAYDLAKAFWPGPLTLILPRADHVLPLVTGGQDSIGLRIPGHPLARHLIEIFGGGVAAPSANRFGKLSPTTAEAVRQCLGDDVDLILDGGPCQVGIESTIVSLLGERPAILRPGMIAQKQIEAVLGAAVTAAGDKTSAGQESQTVRVPGALASHYAPHTPMAVVRTEDLIEMFGEGVAIGRSQGVIAFAATIEVLKANFGGVFYSVLACEAYIAAPPNAAEYAQALYENLRKLDQLALHKILVEAVPSDPAWDGVRDRLARAHAGS
jgi:L-threonylcarbamoyladenylate synthase